MGQFDPGKHLIQLKGKLYLETRYRIQWFREDHPRGCISTELINLDPVIVKATVYDAEGAILGTAHAGAVEKGNVVWSGRSVEKSETAAIGRALAHAGYGTQFAGVDEDGSLIRIREIGNGGDRRSQPSPPLASEGGRDAAAQREREARTQPRGSIEDLRDKDGAARFIQYWRGQSLTDTEVLAALGVTKLSDWTKGRAAADKAVNDWMAGKAAKKTG